MAKPTVEEQIPISRGVCLDTRPARAHSKHPKSFITYSLLQPARGNALTMLSLRRAIQTATNNVSDDDLLHEIAAKVANGSFVLHQISVRDMNFLNRFYDPVAKLASSYDVNPALVLGVAAESGFAAGADATYNRTGDVFGMTGGSTKHMTHVSSDNEDAEIFFKSYGAQIKGTKSNVDAFMKGLQGQDAKGQHVKGWKTYNSEYAQKWHDTVLPGIRQMLAEVPPFLALRAKGLT